MLVRFEDPMPFQCECGHADTYAIESLLTLQAQCSACGFSLRQLGLSVQGVMDAAHACSKLAVIAVELELEHMVSFDDPELEELVLVSDLYELLNRKLSGSAPRNWQIISEKLLAHADHKAVPVAPETRLADLFGR